jgi:hypothetical protein
MSIPFIYSSFEMPSLIFRDCIYEFTINDQKSKSIARFGGKLYGYVRDSLDEDVHHLMTLDLSQLGLRLPRNLLFEIPLLYGFIYDNCQMSYQVQKGEISKIKHQQEIRKYADFPYPEYPSVFPVSQLLPTKTIILTEDLISKIFFERKEMPDLTNQILVVVPPNPKYRVSLWGEEGDAEHVQVVFLIDLIHGTVIVENQCS